MNEPTTSTEAAQAKDVRHATRMIGVGSPGHRMIQNFRHMKRHAVIAYHHENQRGKENTGETAADRGNPNFVDRLDGPEINLDGCGLRLVLPPDGRNL